MREHAEVFLRVESTGEFDPDEVCSDLNLEPVYMWEKGDLTRAGRIRETSGFRAELASDLDWRVVLAILGRTVEKHGDFLRSVVQDEAATWALEVVLHVGGDRAFARCVDFPAPLLESVSEANGTIEVYAYPCFDGRDVDE